MRKSWMAGLMLTLSMGCSDATEPSDDVVSVPVELIPMRADACERSKGHFSAECKRRLIEATAAGIATVAACTKYGPLSLQCWAAGVATGTTIGRYEDYPGEDGHANWQEHWNDPRTWEPNDEKPDLPWLRR